MSNRRQSTGLPMYRSVSFLGTLNKHSLDHYLLNSTAMLHVIFCISYITTFFLEFCYYISFVSKVNHKVLYDFLLTE